MSRRRFFNQVDESTQADFTSSQDEDNRLPPIPESPDHSPFHTPEGSPGVLSIADLDASYQENFLQRFNMENFGNNDEVAANDHLDYDGEDNANQNDANNLGVDGAGGGGNLAGQQGFAFGANVPLGPSLGIPLPQMNVPQPV